MQPIELNVRFSSKVQQAFVESTKRNICWNSGYGAGKTFAACIKILMLMLKFPGYRVAIGRYKSTELRRTTMQTFFKICPPSLYDEAYGGKRADSLGYVRFINGSLVYWMHFDEFDESALRSLEINSAIIDQCEEIPESVYLTLDARVGRWDGIFWESVEPGIKSRLRINKFTGKPEAPAYMIILTNPPDEGEFSWIFQRFHPNSPEHQEKFSESHAYFESSSLDNEALQEEIKATMLTRSDDWVQRFVYGRFQRGRGAIHLVEQDCILGPEYVDVVKKALKQSNLARILDHGASSPTSCLWFAAWGDFHVAYREYYQADRTVSYHRKEIAKLSGDEFYTRNIADPAIFKKTLEKYGGFWTVSEEYLDLAIDAPALVWTPGDNNELATRNRINELLKIDPSVKNPFTGAMGSPRLFFLKKTSDGWGVEQVIRQVSSQKKRSLGSVNGQPIYCDEREPSVEDHAYDCLRYYCASHLQKALPEEVPVPKGSFKDVVLRMKALKHSGYFDRYGVPRHG